MTGFYRSHASDPKGRVEIFECSWGDAMIKNIEMQSFNDNKHYDRRHKSWHIGVMENDFYTLLREAIKRSGKSQAEIYRQTGVQQASLSRFINEGQGLTASNAIKITNFLGGRIHFPRSGDDSPTIRRPGSNAPTELVEGEALPTVPVYGTTGAGAATELFTGEPETLIQVLPQYNLPDVAAFCVDGDSMEPTIMKGSYVGVVPFSGNISEGGIYLVNMPPFGRVIKRIRMGASGSIELHSDNKVYQPIPLPFEGYEEIVKGKVVWIWQLC